MVASDFKLEFIGEMPLQTFDFTFRVQQAHDGKSDADQAQDSTDTKAQVEMVVQEVHNVRGVSKLTPPALGSRPTIFGSDLRHVTRFEEDGSNARGES